MADWSWMARNPFGSNRKDAPVAPRDDSLHPTQRRWSLAEKMRIVSESFAPDAEVASVAARHGVSRVALTRWRSQTMRGELGSLPGVTPPPPAVVSMVMDEAPPGPSEMIGDEVPSDPSVSVTIEAGGVVVRLPGDSPVDRIVAVASGLRLTP